MNIECQRNQTTGNFESLVVKIDRLNRDFDTASSDYERNYLAMEIMVAEEVLESTIDKGRR